MFVVEALSNLRDLPSNKMEQKYFLAKEYNPKPISQSAKKSRIEIQITKVKQTNYQLTYLPSHYLLTEGVEQEHELCALEVP